MEKDRPLLALEQVNTFYGKSHILHGLSLQVDSGEVVGLLGRNGAGKTTTMRTIMGMNPPRKGRIVFQGQQVTRWPPHRIFRAGIHLVPQGRRIFPQLSVAQNLKLAMFNAGVSDAKQAFAQTYQQFPRLQERQRYKAGYLSGGERQMLAIARALLGRPSLILFDEPSEGLAPIIVAEIERIILRIARQGIAILLAEQNVRMALRIAARNYVIDKGRVRFEGTSDQIEANEEVKAFLGVSTRRANAL